MHGLRLLLLACLPAGALVALTVACGGNILVGEQADGSPGPTSSTDSGTVTPTGADGQAMLDAARPSSADAAIYSPACFVGEGLCCTSSGYICDPGGAMCPSPPLPSSACDASCLAYTIPVACSLVLGPLGPTSPLACGDNPSVCTAYGAGCDTTQTPAVCACPSCENGALCGGPSCGTGLTCIGKKTGAQTGPVCVPSFTCCAKGPSQVDPTCTAGSCVCPAGYSEEPLGSVCKG